MALNLRDNDDEQTPLPIAQDMNFGVAPTPTDAEPPSIPLCRFFSSAHHATLGSTTDAVQRRPVPINVALSIFGHRQRGQNALPGAVFGPAGQAILASLLGAVPLRHILSTCTRFETSHYGVDDWQMQLVDMTVFRVSKQQRFSRCPLGWRQIRSVHRPRFYLTEPDRPSPTP